MRSRISQTISLIASSFACPRAAWISSGVMRGRGSGCGVFTLHFLSLSSLS